MKQEAKRKGLNMRTRIGLAVLALLSLVLLSGVAEAVPAPGWQCMPYAGVAEYTLDNCSDHSPVFVYLGDGTSVLAYAIFTVPVESGQGACFPQARGGWVPVEFGAQPVSSVGANTLRGEDIHVDFYPGAPSDQACLDSLRMPWPNVRVTYTRVDEQYVLMTMEPVTAVLKGKASKKE